MLARGAAFDVFAHELHETRPPEFRGDELASLEVAWVSGGFVVMAMDKDRAMEGILRGDVDATCYAWSWVRGKRSLWVESPRYEEGLLLVGSRGSYARDFLGKGQGFEDTF